jgi:hypothetical protein
MTDRPWFRWIVRPALGAVGALLVAAGVLVALQLAGARFHAPATHTQLAVVLAACTLTGALAGLPRPLRIRASAPLLRGLPRSRMVPGWVPACGATLCLLLAWLGPAWRTPPEEGPPLVVWYVLPPLLDPGTARLTLRTSIPATGEDLPGAAWQRLPAADLPGARAFRPASAGPGLDWLRIGNGRAPFVRLTPVVALRPPAGFDPARLSGLAGPHGLTDDPEAFPLALLVPGSRLEPSWPAFEVKVLDPPGFKPAVSGVGGTLRLFQWCALPARHAPPETIPPPVRTFPIAVYTSSSLSLGAGPEVLHFQAPVLALECGREVPRRVVAVGPNEGIDVLGESGQLQGRAFLEQAVRRGCLAAARAPAGLVLPARWVPRRLSTVGALAVDRLLPLPPSARDPERPSEEHFPAPGAGAGALVMALLAVLCWWQPERG